jgi:Na+/proline symporter
MASLRTAFDPLIWVLLYSACLVLVAWHGEKSIRVPAAGLRAAVIYGLTALVYNTAVAFFAMTGYTARQGLELNFVGPALVILFGRPLIVRMIAVAKAQNIVSVADFLGARYGKSSGLAVLVTVLTLIVLVPQIALQLRIILKAYDFVAAPLGTGPDEALSLTVLVAGFTLWFGVRRLPVREHHRGLMLAVAFGAAFKVFAYVTVALGVLFAARGGIEGLIADMGSRPDLRYLTEPHFNHPVFYSTELIAGIALLCFPQMFHVLVVENQEPRHVKAAQWSLLGFILILYLLLPLIAAAGIE